MFCEKCGKELPDGGRFCLYCGAERKSTADNNIWAGITAEDLYSVDGRTKGKRRGRKIITGVSVALGFILCTVLAVVIARNMIHKSKKADMMRELNYCKAGDVVRFGSYEQDGNGLNGKEDIEWYVLDVREGKALLLSKYVLDAVNYRGSVWEDSYVREWLNGDFYQKAFDDDEKEIVLETHVKNVGTVPEYSMSELKKEHSVPVLAASYDGEDDTMDRLFCLSVDELAQYFGYDFYEGYGFTLESYVREEAGNGMEDMLEHIEREHEYVTSCDERMLCRPTDYAKKKGIRSNFEYVLPDGYQAPAFFENAAWHLRSFGVLDDPRKELLGGDPHCIVTFSGLSCCAGDIEDYGVRPALWVKVQHGVNAGGGEEDAEDGQEKGDNGSWEEDVDRNDFSEEETDDMAADEGGVDTDYELNRYVGNMTDTRKNFGHEYRVTIEIGDWVRGTDTETINGAWNMVGGKTPITKELLDGIRNYKYSDVSACMCFGRLSIENITEGWDASDTNVLSPYIGLTMENSDYRESYKIDVFCEYASGFKRICNPSMKKNSWGPVPIMFLVPNAFSPSMEDGDPVLDKELGIGFGHGNGVTFRIGRERLE